MKKGFYLVLLLGIMVSTGFAQIGVSKGLIGGLNLATVGGDDAGSGVKSVTSFAAGLYLELNIPGPLSFEANALYSMKGAKREAGSITYTDTYSYVDVPILLKYNIPLPAARPYICAGPMYSTLPKREDEAGGGLSTR